MLAKKIVICLTFSFFPNYALNRQTYFTEDVRFRYPNIKIKAAKSFWPCFPINMVDTTVDFINNSEKVNICQKS